jgi:diazepam-binding inhibitor (GABA receptor modulator, acyl-CoA-binding protein)
MEGNFEKAAQEIRDHKDTHTQKQSDEVQRDVYGLFKQATVGDVNIAKPSDSLGSKKWDAWNMHKGLSQADARQRYIDLAKSFLPPACAAKFS